MTAAAATVVSALVWVGWAAVGAATGVAWAEHWVVWWDVAEHLAWKMEKKKKEIQT